MKKIFAAILLGLTLISSTSTVYAANNVSNMATLKGGNSVAECAQMMDQGVSACAKSTGCHMLP